MNLELDQDLDKILSKLKPVFKPTRGYLFGSRARGDAKSESDYDILLVVQNSELSALDRMSEAQTALRGAKAPPTDVFVVTEKEFEKHKNDFGSIVETAIFEGRELSFE